MPKEPPPPAYLSDWGEQGQPDDGALASGDVFTDGAMSSVLGMVRRAGWGVVVLAADDSVAWTLFGTMPERFPTVVRSELRAVLEALRRAAGSVRIYTDNQEVVDGYTHGEQWSTSPRRSGADIWRKIWPLVREFGSENVEVLKVKAHLAADDVRSGKISRRMFIGNWHADRAARAGSRAAERSSPTNAYRAEATRAIRWYKWIAAYAAAWATDTTPMRPEDARGRVGGDGPVGRRRRDDVMRHLRWAYASGKEVCRRCGRMATSAEGKRTLRNSPCLGSVVGRALSRAENDPSILEHKYLFSYGSLRDQGARPVDPDEDWHPPPVEGALGDGPEQNGSSDDESPRSDGETPSAHGAAPAAYEFEVEQPPVGASSAAAGATATAAASTRSGGEKPTGPCAASAAYELEVEQPPVGASSAAAGAAATAAAEVTTPASSNDGATQRLQRQHASVQAADGGSTPGAASSALGVAVPHARHEHGSQSKRLRTASPRSRSPSQAGASLDPALLYDVLDYDVFGHGGGFDQDAADPGVQPAASAGGGAGPLPGAARQSGIASKRLAEDALGDVTAGGGDHSASASTAVGGARRVRLRTKTSAATSGLSATAATTSTSGGGGAEGMAVAEGTPRGGRKRDAPAAVAPLVHGSGAEAEPGAAADRRVRPRTQDRDLGRVQGDWGHGHRLVFHANVVWCQQCGRFAAERVGVGLARPCRGAATGFYATRLSRLRDGRHPMTGAPLS